MASLKDTEQKTELTSRVSERISWLMGRKVSVRVTYAELGQMGSDAFTATFLDCIPLGRAYFFVFSASNKRRLVQTDHVREMSEVSECETS